MAKQGNKRCDQLPVLHPDAAGIDVGASELFVAVSADRDSQSVRRFPTFTRDLHALADWLQQCGVRSVAMESTSVYRIPIYQILEARGFDVCLVNAQHVNNVPGRKTKFPIVSGFSTFTLLDYCELASDRRARSVLCVLFGATAAAWSRWRPSTSCISRNRWFR